VLLKINCWGAVGRKTIKVQFNAQFAARKGKKRGGFDSLETCSKREPTTKRGVSRSHRTRP